MTEHDLHVALPGKHVPKHRRPAAHRAPRTAVRTLVLLSSLAVVGTGTAVAGGALTISPQDATGDLASAPAVQSAALDSSATQARTDALEAAAVEAAQREADQREADQREADQVDADQVDTDREVPVSRSDRRGVADPVKEAALAVEGVGNAMTRSEDMSDDDPRSIARALMAEFGYSSDQFGCLDSLWTRESGWRVDADNPSSSAYGIPQSLPGSKMASFGDDWATNPVTQIRWGLDYIGDRYGSPCSAWGHSQSVGWY